VVGGGRLEGMEVVEEVVVGVFLLMDMEKGFGWVEEVEEGGVEADIVMWR
jgi:hypothetical protein